MTETTTTMNCETIANKLLTVEQALAKMLSPLNPSTKIASIPLSQALNRIIAQSIQSPLAIPPYTNSAMDGYALAAKDLSQERLTVIGTAFAGKPFQARVESGQCVRIMTGAVLPKGTDTVIMQEQVQCFDNQQIKIQGQHQAGENIRAIGEDVQPNDTVMTKGQTLLPAQQALLASLGVTKIKVYQPLKVAFFSTGDELKELGQTLAYGQLYDSNRYSLSGMLNRAGVKAIDLGIIPDQADKIEQLLLKASQQADVIVTSGGVSVGEADYVKQSLEKLGEVHFWKMAMKPGKPLAFGKIKHAWFFGLPGNPVSVMATFYLFVQPALFKLMGKTDDLPIRFQVPCLNDIKREAGRMEFQRGQLHYNNDGKLVVTPLAGQGSHCVQAMSHANCFIIIPQHCAYIEKNSLVEVQPFAGLV